MKILFGIVALIFTFVDGIRDLDGSKCFDLKTNESFPNFNEQENEDSSENLNDIKTKKMKNNYDSLLTLADYSNQLNDKDTVKYKSQKKRTQSKACSEQDKYNDKKEKETVDFDQSLRKSVEEDSEDLMLPEKAKKKTPVVSIESRENENVNFDINDIWKLLEPRKKSKRKRKKKNIRKAKRLPKNKYLSNNENDNDNEEFEYKKERLKKRKTTHDKINVTKKDLNVRKKTKTSSLDLAETVKITIPKSKKYITKNSTHSEIQSESDNAYKKKRKRFRLLQETVRMNYPTPTAFKTNHITITRSPIRKTPDNFMIEEAETVRILFTAKPRIVPVQKSSNFQDQTVQIYADRIAVPIMPPPTNLKMTVSPARKSNCMCVPDYAGTITTTRTSLTILPISITDHKVVTKTQHYSTTQILTEILYTPYTLTATTTDTLYMMKVTTVYKGNRSNNCELDSNGMVLPANQLPPGLFATPINEVDSSKFDIVGWAGMNSKNYNHRFNGYNLQMPRINPNIPRCPNLNPQMQKIYP